MKRTFTLRFYQERSEDLNFTSVVRVCDYMFPDWAAIHSNFYSSHYALVSSCSTIVLFR